MPYDMSTSLGRLSLIHLVDIGEPDSAQLKLASLLASQLAEPLMLLMKKPMGKRDEEINEAFEKAIGQPIRFTLDHLPAALEEVIAIATGRLLLSHLKIQGISPDTIVAFLLRGYKWYHQVKDGTLDHLSESHQEGFVTIKLKTMLPEAQLYRYFMHNFHINPWQMPVKTSVPGAVYQGMNYASYIINYISEDLHTAKLSLDMNSPRSKTDTVAINRKTLLEGAKRAKHRLENWQDVLGKHVYELEGGIEVAKAFYLGCIWMFKGVMPYAKAVKFWVEILGTKQKLSKEDFNTAARMFGQVRERLIYQLHHMKRDFEAYQEKKSDLLHGRLLRDLGDFLESEDTWGCFGLGIRRSSEKVTTIGVFLMQLILAECKKQDLDDALVEMFLEAFMLGCIRKNHDKVWTYNQLTDRVDLHADMIFSNYYVLDAPAREKFKRAGVPEYCISLFKSDDKKVALEKGKKWGKGMRREIDYVVNFLKMSGEYPDMDKSLYMEKYSIQFDQSANMMQAHRRFDAAGFDFEVTASFMLGAAQTFVHPNIAGGSVTQMLKG